MGRIKNEPGFVLRGENVLKLRIVPVDLHKISPKFEIGTTRKVSLEPICTTTASGAEMNAFIDGYHSLDTKTFLRLANHSTLHYSLALGAVAFSPHLARIHSAIYFIATFLSSSGSLCNS
jgi:hypothetical protein